jgi:predicted nucleotide-binding protein (sugar kinase/HSP70/actin superfamily)
MTGPNDQVDFDRFRTNVKQFDISGKTLLIPFMSQFGSPLIAASFRAVGVPAYLMETYTGLHLGKEFTSGKECFPCQLTLGDILYHLKKEKERLGAAFSPDRYVYFLPEADGPCRFGMYTKMQRLVLDRFEEFKDIPIVYLSTGNSYAASGILPPERASIFRKLCYVVIVAADIMDRAMWRVRPYELRPGMTDEFMDAALAAMESCVETVGGKLDFQKIWRLMEDIVATARSFIDPHQPRRPRIGIVGEIFLRSHSGSNQDIVKHLERYGGEVVDASMAEWINFVTAEQIRKLRRSWGLAWDEGNHEALRKASRQLIALELDRLYQLWRQKQMYRMASQHLDIAPDHSIKSIERRLDKNRLFHFAIGTEAALSIGGAMEYAQHGYDGILNVFPFTCMPSTICSAVLKPLLHEKKIPFIDAPYDGGIQPNREVALRTFIYQARQHMESRLAGRNGKALT